MIGISPFVKRVVNTCLRIGKDDRVLIYAYPHILDLAKAFVLECRRTGAKTILQIDTDETYYDLMLNLPLDYLETPNPLELALLDAQTAAIILWGPENPERMKEVKPKRWAALFEGEVPYRDKWIKKKIRTANIRLGQVTPQRAKTYGFDYDVWKKSVVDASDVEYEEIKKLGIKISNMLKNAKNIRVTTPKGTNITFSLEDRPIFIYDGIVDEEDIRKGDPAVSLPSGVIGFAPSEPSVNGKFVSDVPQAFAAKLVHDVSWVFEDGKIISFEGSKNLETLKSSWENAKGDKDRLGLFMLGLNPRAKTGFLENELVLGTVTLAIGDNKAQGGKNDTSWYQQITATQPTIELDGKPIIRQGQLTL
ncbi:MAG: aminopeptidase [Promethearchaeota archaeon]